MVTTFYPPYSFGGDATYIYRLTNELARRGHEVEVVHCADAYCLLNPAGPKGNFPNHPNVTVHTLRGKVGALSPLVTQQTGLPAFKAPALRRIVERGRFDVLHFHNMSLIGPAALAYGGSRPIKLYTTHEHWMICPMHVLWKYNSRVCERPTCFSCQVAGKRPPQLWRYTPVLRRWLAHVDAFISPSRFTLRMHRERGLPNLPIRHIPYFLPTSEEHAPEERLASVTAADEQRPYFLFVGRLERIKGLQNVIEVFRSYDRAELLIAGDGEYGDELRAQAARLPHVRFLGRLPHAELRSLYRGALASLVPSICYEVFGIVIIESFAMRTPVIAHNLGALPEVVEESGGGFTYRTAGELVAAMEQLRTNPGLRDDLGGRGYDAYRRLWAEEPHLRAYFGLLQEIADRKGLVLPELSGAAAS